jgi:flagellar hook capping protein FlgD
MRCSSLERVLPQPWGSRSRVAAAVLVVCLLARSGISSAATRSCTVVGCCTAICPDSTIAECHKGVLDGCTCICRRRPSLTGLNIEGTAQLDGQITVTALDVSYPSDSLVPARTLLQATLFVAPGQSHRALAQALAANWRSQIRAKDSLKVVVSGDAVTVESPRVAAKYLVCSGSGPCAFGDANDLDLGVQLNGLTFRGIGQGRPGEGSGATDSLKLVIEPNPSRVPQVRFRVPRASVVDVSIFDLFGRRVATLVHATLHEGSYSHRWNGDDDSGRRARDGLYFCRIVAGDAAWIERVQLLR